MGKVKVTVKPGKTKVKAEGAPDVLQQALSTAQQLVPMKGARINEG